MTTPRHSIEIIIRPKNQGRMFDAFLGVYGHATRLLCRAKDPWHAAARVLIAEGRDPESLLTMSYEGQNCHAMRGTLGKAAKFMVIEEDKGGLRLRPYKEPRIAPERVHEGGGEAPGLAAADRPLPY